MRSDGGTTQTVNRMYSWFKPDGESLEYVDSLNTRAVQLRKMDFSSRSVMQEWIALGKELMRLNTSTLYPGSPPADKSSTAATPDRNQPPRIITAPPRRCVITRQSLTEPIGMQIQSSKSMPVPKVSWIKSDGPAQAAGLLVGDILVEINGHDCIGLSNIEIAKVIQGQRDSELQVMAATLPADSQTKQTIQKISEIAAKPSYRPLPTKPVVSDLNEIFACAAEPEARNGSKTTKSSPTKGKSRNAVARSLFKPDVNSGVSNGKSSKTAVKAKAKAVVGAIVDANTKSKVWKAPKSSRGTFSDPSALSRGSKYNDKPPTMKAFWEKEGSSEKGSSKRRVTTPRSKTIKTDVQPTVGLKDFISEQRKGVKPLDTEAIEADHSKLRENSKSEQIHESTSSLNTSVISETDQLILRLQHERDEARSERDISINQLAAVTQSYEDLVNSKEEEIERLHKAADAQRRNLLERTIKNDVLANSTESTKAEMEDLSRLREELVNALERSTSDNTMLVSQNKDLKLKVHSISARLSEAVAAKEADRAEIGELRAMNLTMDEALKAKDEVARIKHQSFEEEIAELQKELRSGSSDHSSDGIQHEIMGLKDELRQTKDERDEAIRRALEGKQAEMAESLDSLRASLKQGGQTNDLRNAIVAKEEEKQSAVAELEREKAEFIKVKDEEVKEAIARKDQELSRALDLAQQEVDRLLEEKQEEVDEILDEKDSIIATLIADLKEANVRARLGGSEGTAEGENSIVSELRELVDMKNALLLSKEHDFQKMQQGFEDEMTSLGREQQYRIDQIVSEKDAELQAIMSQMESALTDAMSAKGDLLCLDEKANELISKKLEKAAVDDTSVGALVRVENALANTDSAVNREVIRLKLQIARLQNADVDATQDSEVLENAQRDDSIVSLQEENIKLFEEIRDLKIKGAQISIQSATPNSASVESATVGSQTDEKDLAEQQESARITSLQNSITCTQQELDESRARFLELELRYDKTVLRCKELQAQLADSEERYEAKVAEVRGYDVARRRLLNEIMDLKGNARVICRVRPVLSNELQPEHQCVHLMSGADAGTITIVDPTGQDVRGDKVIKKHDFEFNHVLGPDASQVDVYNEVDTLIQCALSGFNVVIFAYGQTGSGKTYTMTGESDPNLEGIIPRCVRKMFDELKNLSKRDWEYTLRVSFLEIYNETIRDLLADESVYKVDRAGRVEAPRYDIKQDKNGSMYVTNLTIRTVSSAAEVSKLVEAANKNRAVGVSDMNDRSSRSHSICQLVLEGRNSVTESVVSSKICLVDLAGSERLVNPTLAIEAAPMDERARLSAEYAIRQKETLSINKSLSNLANVVQAIHLKSTHVPYRNSKLTYILKDALGGDSKSLMMVNISQREDCLSESLCSLRFAAKVNNTSFGKPGRSIPVKESK